MHQGAPGGRAKAVPTARRTKKQQARKPARRRLSPEREPMGRRGPSALIKELKQVRQYELMYILDPTLDEDGSKALIGKIEEFMGRQGVEVEKTEGWGKRRLSYRIKGHWEGNYILSHLKASPSSVAEMERRLRVTDGILRFLTVRIDEQQAKLERRRARTEERDRQRRLRRSARAAEQVSSGSGGAAPPPEQPPTAETSGTQGD